MREAIDGVFRTGRQAEQALRVKCLSVIPLATSQAVPALASPPRSIAEVTHPDDGPWPVPQPQSDESSGILAAPVAPRYGFIDPLKRRG